MSEQEEQALRALVRQAVAAHLHRDDRDHPQVRPLVVTTHASHYRYALPASGGPCLIEPAVQCNHCGYCESHGH
jgi:hypothetical protein